ncbi:MAG: acetate/propionate family kinase [Burkholderiales bacterium]|nr:acetate/propionate family kinase [Burkholderiales bacterium]
MTQVIAVINAGSSSLKFSLYEPQPDALRFLAGGQIEALFTAPRLIAHGADGGHVDLPVRTEAATLGHEAALDALIEFLRVHFTHHTLVAIGHRVVHGGARYARPVRVDAEVLAALERFIPLAPLHQPHNLALIRVVAARRPELAQVACFDTAFHRSQARVTQAFALPHEFAERGVLRYGFHGLSYEYIAQALPACDAKAATGRTVVLHLGNGASMCAMRAGRSVASTMGFTAVDGLPMGTRCGNLDPGVLLFCLDHLGMDARAIEKLVYQQSGLLGMSGISSDMRTLEASDDPRAREAIDIYIHRIGRELGSLAAALGGLDAIVFTAGIGQNSVALRERVCRDAAWLGVAIDPAANRAGEQRISTAASRVTVLVVPTDEELMIARHTRAVLEATAATRPSP